MLAVKHYFTECVYAAVTEVIVVYCGDTQARFKLAWVLGAV